MPIRLSLILIINNDKLMKKNMGTLDRSIRAAIALVLMYLNLTGSIGAGLSILIWILSSVLLLTSLIAFCPIYTLLGLNTCPKDNV